MGTIVSKSIGVAVSEDLQRRTTAPGSRTGMRRDYFGRGTGRSAPGSESRPARNCANRVDERPRDVANLLVETGVRHRALRDSSRRVRSSPACGRSAHAGRRRSIPSSRANRTARDGFQTADRFLLDGERRIDEGPLETLAKRIALERGGGLAFADFGHHGKDSARAQKCPRPERRPWPASVRLRRRTDVSPRDATAATGRTASVARSRTPARNRRRSRAAP